MLMWGYDIIVSHYRVTFALLHHLHGFTPELQNAMKIKMFKDHENYF